MPSFCNTPSMGVGEETPDRPTISPRRVREPAQPPKQPSCIPNTPKPGSRRRTTEAAKPLPAPATVADDVKSLCSFFRRKEGHAWYCP